MAYKQLYINGTGTGTFGIYISSDTYLNAPSPDYVAHQIPGRYGDLVQWNNRFNNVVRKFSCYIPKNTQANMDGFKKFLYSQIGYVEITSDYESDTYQRGYLAEEITAEPFLKDAVLSASFDLYFSCEPQKYFKSNTSTTITFVRNTPLMARIYPRSNMLIQALFQAIPVDAIPSGDAFAVLFITPSAYPTLETFSHPQFSMSGYEGFVAMVIGETMFVPNLAKLKSVAGYSTNGVIDDPDYTFTTPDFSEGVAVILPANTFGTFTASIDRNGTTMSETITMASMGNVTNVDAVGGHYAVTIEGEYGRDQSMGTTDPTGISVLMRGSLNGEETFSTLIIVDTTCFRNLAEGANTYPTSVTINTDDLSVSAIFDGEPVNISNYVGIWGETSGMADKIELITYREYQSTHATIPFWYNTFTIAPTWWKI